MHGIIFFEDNEAMTFFVSTRSSATDAVLSYKKVSASTSASFFVPEFTEKSFRFDSLSLDEECLNDFGLILDSAY